MKTRNIIIATTIVASALLGACGSPSTSETKQPVSQDSKVNALVSVLGAKYPGASKSKLIDIAQQACTVIDQAGGVAAAVATVVADDSIDSATGSDIAYIMGVAVPVYCPQYKPELDRITAR
jgi:hypothetical protein